MGLKYCSSNKNMVRTERLDIDQLFFVSTTQWKTINKIITQRLIPEKQQTDKSELMYPKYMSMLFTVKIYKANISVIS